MTLELFFGNLLGQHMSEATMFTTLLLCSLAQAATLRADLDGDGRRERLRLTEDRIEVRWRDRATEVLGVVPVLEEGEPHGPTEDFSWVVHWTRVSHDARSIQRFATTALGEGVLCSSEDVALLLYLSPEGFKLEHLGF